MNFLAHLYLSGRSEDIMVGNFLGDFVKGSQWEEYGPLVQRGIHLHRAIDSYTDSHPTVSLSKDRLRPRYRHYAGVIVDVFYDHFLAHHWGKFHQWRLEAFAAHCYDVLGRHHHALPVRAQHMLPYMERGNWLVGYRYVEGIHRSLSGMARRTSFDSHMEEASRDLREHYSAFEAEFLEFFPQLQAHAAEFLKNR